MIRKVHPTYGTVSHGTMRPRDVLPAYMDVLLEYHPNAYQEVTSTISDELGITYTELCSNQSNLAWDTTMMSWIMESVWDAMSEIAPDGYYFGAHTGDGCDYGFWKCEHPEEEAK